MTRLFIFESAAAIVRNQLHTLFVSYYISDSIDLYYY